MYEREVTGSHSTQAKNFSFSSSLDLDITCSSQLTQPADALVSHYQRAAEQNQIEVWPRPRDGKRARFDSRCCPWVLSGRKQFYCSHLLSGAFASEAARQLTCFSG